MAPCEVVGLQASILDGVLYQRIVGGHDEYLAFARWAACYRALKCVSCKLPLSCLVSSLQIESLLLPVNSHAMLSLLWLNACRWASSLMASSFSAGNMPGCCNSAR